RYFLNHVTNTIFELDHGNLYKYEGNYELFLEKKVEREALEHRLEQKHQNTLRRELAWLNRGARARSTKQRARIERIDELKNNKCHTKNPTVAFYVAATRLGKQISQLEKNSKRFQMQTKFSDFPIPVTPADRSGIIGSYGSGKSSLLKIIAECLPPATGTA